MNSSNECPNPDSKQTEEELRQSIREHYAKVVTSVNTGSAQCCGASGASFAPNTDEDYAFKLGYTQQDLSEVPERTNLGLGCGNPIAFANLQIGETVLDLGSGTGFDAIIAARIVGPTGGVIGVDMTPEMVSKARRNALKSGHKNVEFRLGAVEDMPIDNNSIDVIISNRVISLVPNKAKVFAECYRVLRSGGRLAITDVVTNEELPDSVRADLALHSGCLVGATLISDLKKVLKRCRFIDIKITPIEESREFIKDWAPGMRLEEFVVSALIEAKKR